MNELMQQLPAEIKRVTEMTNTFEGWRNVIAIYEKHFNEKYEHGDNVVYEVARVNILRKLRNAETLC
jgi:ribosomal protein S17E